MCGVIVATSPNALTPLSLATLPSRKLGEGECRVRVRSIGVNPVDWKMREGGPLRLAHHFVGPSGPLVVGVDFAGEVVEGAGDLPVGARVVGGTDFSRKQLGSYADEVIVKPDQCALLPDSISFEQAAGLPVPGVTAWRALTELAGIDKKKDTSVLILGASGGVGLCGISLARSLGAKVVGVCSGKNAPLVTSMGAIAIDYTQGDPLEAARAHGPYELILHAVGTATYALGVCRSLLTGTGVVSLVVVRPADYPSLAVCGNVRTVLGRPGRALLDPLVAAMARGDISTLVEATFPLADAEEAHARSRKGKVVGKLLLAP